MRSSEDCLERFRAAVVQELDLLIDATERRRVVPLVAITRGAESKIVNLAVGELRTAVASRAAGFITFKPALAALGRGRKRTVFFPKWIWRRLQLLQVGE